MWLTFSTEGGLVTGAADLVSSCTLSERGTTCDRVSSSFHLEFVGTYSPDTNTLDGTYNERQDDEIETWTADESDECTTEKESRIVSGTWGATLRDGVVMASYGSPRGMLFELTVQGQ